MLMQSYPGGIESGTDWYQNDAGVVLTETTIRQTPFNIQGHAGGLPRAHGDSVRRQRSTKWWQAAGHPQQRPLHQRMADRRCARTTRSPCTSWAPTTPRCGAVRRTNGSAARPGFYWGDNNAKDLTIRLETMPDPQGAPEYVPYVPMPRDLAWQELLPEVQGPDRRAVRIPRVPHGAAGGASTMDAKVVTADMANRMMVWAEIGKPNQREWLPGGRSGYSGNNGLYPSGYYLFQSEAPAALGAEARAARQGAHSREDARFEGPPVEGLSAARLGRRYLARRRGRRLPPGAAVQ